MGQKLGLLHYGRMRAVHVPEQGAKEKDVTEHCRKLHNGNLYDCAPHKILLGL